MILTRRILPFVISLVVGLGFYGIFIAIDALVWWLIMLSVAVSLACAFLLQWKVWSAQFFWITTPLLFLVITSAGVAVMVPNEWMSVAYVIVAAIMTGVYIEDVFIMLFQSYKYTQLSLPLFCIFLNVWSAYGLALIGFTALLLHITQPWVVIVVAGIFGLYLGGHILWSFALWKKQMWSIPVITALLLAEYAWILTTLPFSFIVTAFLFAIVVYALSSYIQLIYRNAYTFDTMIRPTIVSVLGSMAILLTTRWFY